jgi:transcriptional regulator with XRE-family HTH domain
MQTLEQIIEAAKGEGDYQSLAARLGVNKGSITKWRQGLSAPDPQYIPELARLAGLSVAAVAIAALATRDRHGTQARHWRRAWDDLARAGLAAVVLAVGLGAQAPAEAQPTPEVAPVRHYANSRRRRRQEAATAASRWLSRLSGRVNNNQPARYPYVIWRIQKLTARTLRRLCTWPRGYSALSREGLPVASWPTLGLIAA